MSTLISSAVGGKKAAAPKGGIRRRQPPPPGAPGKAVTPISVTNVQTTVAPPSPPRTQVLDTPAPVESDETVESSARSQAAQLNPIAIPTLVQSTEVAPNEPLRPPLTESPEDVITISEQTNDDQTNAQDGEEASVDLVLSKKRKKGPEITAETTQPVKRAKRSSARSNNQVQIAIQEDRPAQLSAANDLVTPRAEARRSATRRMKELLNTTAATEQIESTSQSEVPRTRLRPTPSNKRKQDPAPVKEITQSEIQPAKRVKRSSARRNDKVQAAIQQEESPVATTASTDKAPRSTRSQAQTTLGAEIQAEEGASTSQKSQAKRKAISGTQKAQAQGHKSTATETAQANRKDKHAAEKPRTKEKDTSKTQKTQVKRNTRKKSTGAVVHSDAGETVATAGQQEAREEEAEPQQTAPKLKRKYRRRKKTQKFRQETGAEGAEVNEEEREKDDDSESDPELHEIDPNTVTMWEVGGDKRHGKTSEREKKMAEIDWAEVARKRREENEKALAREQMVPTSDVVETTEGPNEGAESQEQQPAAEETANLPAIGFRVVNGQIVENEESLTIDRRAQAEAEVAQTSDPIQEENDLTKRVNRMNHLNDRRRDKADRIPAWKSRKEAWSDEETDRFYEELRMWGTDFYIISTMFSERSRKQIKSKFVREERLDPERINAALMGKQTKRMDLEHYARETGKDVSEYTKYSGIREAESEIEASLADRRKEMEEVVRARQLDEQLKQQETDRRDKNRTQGQIEGGQTKKKARANKNQQQAADGQAKKPARRKKKSDTNTGAGNTTEVVDVEAGAEV